MEKKIKYEVPNLEALLESNITAGETFISDADVPGEGEGGEE